MKRTTSGRPTALPEKRMIKTNCDFIRFYKYLGSSWTIFILFKLEREPKTFNQLLAELERRINPFLLSLRLKQAISFNIIEKFIYQGKIMYRITPLGNKVLESLIHSRNMLKEEKCNIPQECMEHCRCIRINNNGMDNWCVQQ